MIYKDCHHLTFNMTTLHFIDTAILLKLPSLWVLTVLVLLHLQTVLQATTVQLLIKDTFPGSLKCPLYTGLIVYYSKAIWSCIQLFILEKFNINKVLMERSNCFKPILLILCYITVFKFFLLKIICFCIIFQTKNWHKGWCLSERLSIKPY
jgi:hypothetical protein